MKSYSEISNRYMKENKKRTILTIMGVALATVLIFAIGTFFFSFKDAMLLNERSRGDYEFKINNLNSEQAKRVINNVEIKDGSIYFSGNTPYLIKGTERSAVIYKGDSNYYSKIKYEKIIDGESPKADDEVVIDINVKKFLNVEKGDTITLITEMGETQFKVVGITESGTYISDAPLGLYTYIDENNLSSDDMYSVYVNIKSDKNKQKIIDQVLTDADVEIISENKIENREILYLTGNGGDSAITKSLNNMVVFVILIIVICTVTVIYNSFNISVIERIRYFGILKAIGATPKQIRRIIFKEGAVIGIIALPLGCLIGFFALKFGIDIFIGNNILFIENFTVNFYPKILGLTIVIVTLTILISIMGPSRKAKKVSAVEAMRNNKEINIGKIKRRKGRIVGRVFGIEGNLAYKNIRRTPARFIITVIALTISLIMFNVFYGFLDFTKQIVTDLYGTICYDSELIKSNNNSFSDEEIEKIENQNFSSNIYKINTNYYQLLIEEDKLNPEYEEKTGSKIAQNRNGIFYNGVLAAGASSNVGGEKELNLTSDYIKEGKIDSSSGVILVDGRKITNKDGNKEVIRGTSYKVGDTIKIAKPISDNNKVVLSNEDKQNAIDNNDYIEIPIIAILEKEPIEGQYLTDSLEIIMGDECYNKYIGQFKVNLMFFDFEGNSEKENEAIEYFESIKESNGYSYYDLKQQLSSIDEMFNQIEFFVYCFIIVITIISIVNILNTISTNILIRRKEFSTLKAIGMTEKQLRKSVLLEGTLYGIISGIFGGVISAILLAVLVKFTSGMAVLEYKFDFVAFIGSIVIAILITYVATLIPLRKLNKLSIVEGISDDE